MVKLAGERSVVTAIGFAVTRDTCCEINIYFFVISVLGCDYLFSYFFVGLVLLSARREIKCLLYAVLF